MHVYIYKHILFYFVNVVFRRIFKLGNYVQQCSMKINNKSINENNFTYSEA